MADNSTNSIFNIDHNNEGKISNSKDWLKSNTDSTNYYGNDSTIHFIFPPDLENSKYPGFTAFFINYKRNSLVDFKGNRVNVDKMIYKKDGNGQNIDQLITSHKESIAETVTNSLSKTDGFMNKFVVNMKDVGETTAKSIVDMGILDETVTQKSCIVLPTPNIEPSYSIGYDTSGRRDLNTKVSGLAQLFGSSDSESAFNNLKKASQNVVANYGLKNAMEALEKKSGISGIGQVITSATENPMQESTFNGVGLRSFSFRYKFIPSNETEAKTIEAIVDQFKYHASPGYAMNKNFLLNPATFDIVHYIKQGNDIVINNHHPKLATSVLTQVTVSHKDASGDKNGADIFAGGYQFSTELTLNFKEVVIITKEDIANGF